jgi:hypothetical protein
VAADKNRKRELPLLLADAAIESRELPLLLTLSETGFQLACSERHVYELEALGLLDFCKLGPKATRVTTASVLRLVHQRAKPSGNVPGLRQFATATKEPQSQR